MIRATRTTRLPVSAAEAFAWHARPGAFARLVPPWERVRLRAPHPGILPGSDVLLEVSVGPFRFPWVARHTEVVPDRRFRDEQVSGPFHSWVHTHEFAPAGGDACDLIDTIECSPPAGEFGEAIAAGWLGGQLQRTLQYRHAVTLGDLTLHARFAGRPRLRVAITGASGLIGRTVSALLTTGGYTVTRLVRRAAGPGEITWDPGTGFEAPDALSGVDAVIHLAGESIAGSRWTETQKARIRSSRSTGTKTLAAAIAATPNRPRTMLSASAVGIYGNRDDQILDERSPAGTGFLADVVQTWEAAAQSAADAGTRVVHTRFGIVLTPAGGALAQMLPPFKVGVAGPLGSGRQWMSWVGIDDVAGALLHSLHTEALAGPVNVVAPAPVTNTDFTHTLGGVLHRPTPFRVPAAALRLLFGELADEALLGSTRVSPTVLEASGYQFQHPGLEPCLRHALGREL